MVIAYLMKKLNVDPAEGLRILQESRGVCDPNDGFKEQLRLFHGMGTPDNLDDQPKYHRWLYQRELESSRSVRLAPEAEKIRFEDEYSTNAPKDGFDFKCRKCRYIEPQPLDVMMKLSSVGVHSRHQHT